MLQRDRYKEDPIFAYIPNFSLQKYQQHIVSMQKPFYKLAFNNQQSERWNSRINFTNNAVVATFTLMLIPSIWFRKMPVLKRFTSTFGRVLWTLGFIFVPTNIVNFYFTQKTAQEISVSYSMRNMDFMKYRQTGDITFMNSEINWTEF